MSVERYSDSAGGESDQDLLEKYRRGDVQALEVLVDRYRKPLFGFIIGMTGGQADADEVFQEVWFRVIRKVEDYEHGNFCGWLVRIAHNLVIDRARRRKPIVSLDVPPDEDGPVFPELRTTEPDPRQEMSAGELGRRIRTVVDTLPPRQKEVFLMRTQLDLSFKEIAKVQKTSINTALARMHYAIGKLRLSLRNEYDEVTGRSDGREAVGTVRAGRAKR
jgi:RNA polymerase sigma-70 factor, ECF subfamily